MAIFSQGDVIRVPFPYTDRNTRQNRPALVVSKSAIGEDDSLLWVVMITSAENRPWAGDVKIKKLKTAGLPAPSVVRTSKLATIEVRQAYKLGHLDNATISSVIQLIQKHLFGADLSLSR